MAAPLPAAARRRAPLALLAALLVLAGLRADEPKAPPPGRSLDPAKLPPNAVIIVSDNPRDAFQNVDAVVLTPDEYRKLLDAAEQARRLATPDKPEPPSVCRVSGRVETRGTQDVAVLRVEYQFRTTAPRSVVLLGLQRGKPVAATIDDGKLAVLVPLKEDEGFAVQVDAAGEHRAAVDVEAPLASRGARGGERGIDLGLPGAAITAIERLDLPAGVTRVRVAGRPVPARQLTAGTAAAPAVLLGPTTRLDVAWDVPAPAAKADPQTTVEARYDVRVEDRALVTRARLTLKVQGGPSGRWDVLAPPNADLAPESTGPESTVRVTKPQNKTAPWVVRRDANTDDLVILVTLRTEITPGHPAAVPVFPVAGAVQQSGTITVAGPPHLRLAFRPAADVTRREAADDSHDAAFAFHGLPDAGPLLEIDAQPARGEVETQVGHQLTLAERGWRWQGRFDVRPIRTEVTALDLEVPAELQELRPASAELVEAVTPLRESPAGRKLVRVQLAESRRRAFTFALEGLYPVGGSASAAALPLPRPVGTLDRGGQVTATAPAGLELRGSYREWEGNRVGEWERPLDPAPRGAAGLSAAVERAPARVDLAWRAPRTDVPVTAAVDIQLGERQATVRHQWRVPAGPAAPRQFVARGPAALAGRLRAVDGGTLTPTGPGEWSVQLAAPAARESVLTLSYSFPLPAADPDAGTPRPAVAVPLVWLEPCPRCETDVAVWATNTQAGVLTPARAEGPWTEVPPRVVPDRPTLPALALHGTGPHLPLTLHLAEAAVGPGTGLVVERVWVQAVVDADGQQLYRARCLVRPRQTHYLDVELPAPPVAAQFAAQLDGKRLPWTSTEGPGGRFVRLRLDPADAGRGPRQLDLIYLLPPRPGDTRWQLTLAPPRLRGPVFVGPVRWQIAQAAGDLLLDLGDATAFERRWGWQRGLLAPRPAWTTADLRRWFAPDAGPTTAEADPADGLETALVGWQPAAEPLQFLAVPRPLALLLVSLAVLAAGLAAVRVGSAWRAGGAVVLAAGLVWLAAVRPQALALLAYAAQPGAVVLAVVLAARWVALRRYRRRVLFLPGFARAAPAGSSVVRNGSAGGGVPAHGSLRREPSTIDAPASQAGRPSGEWTS